MSASQRNVQEGDLPLETGEGVRVREVDTERTDEEELKRAAEGIARIYQEAYENYPFKAWERPETVREEKIPGENDVYIAEATKDIEVTNEDGEVLGTIEEGTIMGTGSIKYQEDGQVGELGGGALLPLAQAANLKVYQPVNDTRWDLSDAPVSRAQPVSSEHAKTQYVHGMQNNFATVGVNRNKYPEIHVGEGRETVASMVDANSNFRNVDMEEPLEVHVTSETHPLVDHAIAEIERKRDGEMPSFDRQTTQYGEGEVDVDEFGFQLKTKVDDPDVGGMAAFQVLPGGDMSFDEVEAEIYDRVTDRDYSWVGVELDANHESAAAVTGQLAGDEFGAQKYFPEKLSYRGEENPRDALGLQYSEEPTGNIELTDEVVEAAEAAGLEVEDVEEESGYGHTQMVAL